MSARGDIPIRSHVKPSTEGVAASYSPRDVSESSLYSLDPQLLTILLKDRTTGKNIRWGTDIYQRFGHFSQDEMTIEAITGAYEGIIRPRTDKSLQEQRMRSKDKAEVFTPAWICNEQNNLIDEAWFGYPDVFNTPVGDHNWKPTARVNFPKGKSWQDYILAKRLEVSCGEGPYLTSRFDVVTGAPCQFYARIGILDRKLRVLEEVYNEKKKQKSKRWGRREWFRWAEYAVKSTYGFDWQGDNVLIAREHLLYAVIDAHKHLFPKCIFNLEHLERFARIISWNIWQMDGIKCVVPETCHDEEPPADPQSHRSESAAPTPRISKRPCPGCKQNDIKLHNGVACQVMDWACNTRGKTDTPILFRDLIK